MVAIFGALGERAATKDNLTNSEQRLNKNIADLRRALKQDIANLWREMQAMEQRLLGRIENSEQHMKREIAELRGDMKTMEQRLILRLGAMLAVVVGVLAALITLI